MNVRAVAAGLLDDGRMQELDGPLSKATGPMSGDQVGEIARVIR